MQVAQPAVDGRTRVRLAGVWLDRLTERQLVDQVIASSSVRRGGWIATPNVSILRKSALDPVVANLLEQATMRVADGAPLVWASRCLPGAPLERVTGASLLFSLAEACARHDRSIYILGGEDGAAVEAAARLEEMYPSLRIVGAESPWVDVDLPADDVAPIIERMTAAAPDLVLCGFGFPKQELMIEQARLAMPGTWFLGCGAAVNFAAGRQRRAPQWMQTGGLEWCYRLAQEPRRLARRYAADLPFALRLLVMSVRQLVTRAPIQIPATGVVVVPDVSETLDGASDPVGDQASDPTATRGPARVAAPTSLR